MISKEDSCCTRMIRNRYVHTFQCAKEEGVTNRWTRSQIGQDIYHTGQVRTVRNYCTAMVTVSLVADPLGTERLPRCLTEVLE